MIAFLDVEHGTRAGLRLDGVAILLGPVHLGIHLREEEQHEALIVLPFFEQLDETSRRV